MLTSNAELIRPILESKDGIHLTAYLVNRGHVAGLQRQLRQTIQQASTHLQPALSPKEQAQFLRPLENLLRNPKPLRQIKGHIGLFRNKGSFRLLSLPIEVDQSCQVATSFHVKPLLRWLQTDREYLLLGLEGRLLHVYAGSKASTKLIDSIPIARPSASANSLSPALRNLLLSSEHRIFVAGDKSRLQKIQVELSPRQVFLVPLALEFSKDRLDEVELIIHAQLKADAKQLIERALVEYRFAEEENRGRKNIFQISKAAVQGRIKKLIVASESRIFGKLDKQSGGLAIHPADLDHEDDDLLDDLAQLVLAQGGEVVIASQTQLPKGRPLLAILDGEGESIEARESRLYQALEERFG